MLHPWIRTGAPILISALFLAGCSTTKDAVLPQDGKPMKQIYKEHFERMGTQGVERAREELKRGVGAGDADLRGYVRDAHHEIRTTFPRLPNPTLVMFVFPHLAGSEGVPVPGYATSFPMYERMEYALPGEVSGMGAE
jgi:conjugative transfer region lipoprotein (TIGR03751 family)